ncbi:hypothetical protein J6590_046630 [Homalodisca vitripennis]|nr:hypothetical protein J6590_046630 [Homalodisca vitripennis]
MPPSSRTSADRPGDTIISAATTGNMISSLVGPCITVCSWTIRFLLSCLLWWPWLSLDVHTIKSIPDQGEDFRSFALSTKINGLNVENNDTQDMTLDDNKGLPAHGIAYLQSGTKAHDLRFGSLMILIEKHAVIIDTERTRRSPQPGIVHMAAELRYISGKFYVSPLSYSVQRTLSSEGFGHSPTHAASHAIHSSHWSSCPVSHRLWFRYEMIRSF